MTALGLASSRFGMLAVAMILVLAPADRVAARGGFAGGGGGGARMATASVSGANRAAIENRPGRGDRIDGDGDIDEDGTVDIDRDRYGYGWGYPYYGYEEDNADPGRAEAAATPAPAPPPPAVGSTHGAVPAGCGTIERGGKFLRNCNGVLYEEKFVGDSLVYTVVQ